MSIQTEVRFVLICDVCKRQPDDDDFTPNFGSVNEAWSYADDNEWEIDGDKHTCLSCIENRPTPKEEK